MVFDQKNGKKIIINKPLTYLINGFIFESIPSRNILNYQK